MTSPGNCVLAILWCVLGPKQEALQAALAQHQAGNRTGAATVSPQGSTHCLARAIPAKELTALYF